MRNFRQLFVNKDGNRLGAVSYRIDDEWWNMDMIVHSFVVMCVASHLRINIMRNVKECTLDTLCETIKGK